MGLGAGKGNAQETGRSTNTKRKKHNRFMGECPLWKKEPKSVGHQVKICASSGPARSSKSGSNRSFEDRLECRTLRGFHFLHEFFELFVLLIPLMNSGQQVLGLHLAPHDEKVVVQVVQLVARAVRAIL